MSVSEKTSVIERLTKPAHLIDMKDIIRKFRTMFLFHSLLLLSYIEIV